MQTHRVAVIGGNRIPFARSNGPYRARLQSGHADDRAGRPGGPVRARRRAARRGGGRRGAQAQPGLQPHPRVRARLPARSAHPGVRHPAGLRHRSRGDHRGRQQDRPRPDQRRRRRRRRHDVGRAARGQRRPAPGDAGAQPGEVVARPAPGRGQAQSGTGVPAGDPAQRRTAHRTVDGRARRHHRARVGSRPAVPGRAGPGVAPASRRGVRARFLRRPADAVPGADPRPEPAAGHHTGEAGEAAAGVRHQRARTPRPRR